jgi:hypothetical protein
MLLVYMQIVMPLSLCITFYLQELLQGKRLPLKCLELKDVGPGHLQPVKLNEYGTILEKNNSNTCFVFNHVSFTGGDEDVNYPNEQREHSDKIRYYSFLEQKCDTVNCIQSINTVT